MYICLSVMGLQLQVLPISLHALLACAVVKKNKLHSIIIIWLGVLFGILKPLTIWHLELDQSDSRTVYLS